jgi:hypothetical protein
MQPTCDASSKTGRMQLAWFPEEREAAVIDPGWPVRARQIASCPEVNKTADIAEPERPPRGEIRR